MQPATDSTTALKNLQTYQQQLQTPEAAAQAANKALGVDQAQQQVQGLRGAIQRTTGLLQQISPSVYGRTQNSLVTQAQAGRQIANEQAPVQQDLQNLGTQYSGANQDYQNLQGQANQQAANTLSEQQGQTSYLQSLYQALLGNEQSAKDEAYRQSQLAEQRRQFDASLAQSRASSGGGGGLSPAGLAGGGSAASAYKAADPATLARGAAKTAKEQLLRIGPSPFARERVLESLKRDFPQVDPNVLSDIIYKEVFPDNWAGGGNVPTGQQKGLMQAVGYSG